MKKNDIRKVGTLFLLSFAVIINSLIVFLIYQQGRLAVDDSSAAVAPKVNLTLVSPSSTVGIANGSTIKVAAAIENPGNASVAEFVINYDKNVLEGAAISESTSVIALNKNLGASTGKMTVDITTSGPGTFAANTTLVTFDLTVKNSSGSGTTVSVGTESTLGIPNSLTTGSYGMVQLPFSTQTNNNAQMNLTLTNPTVSPFSVNETPIIRVSATNVGSSAVAEIVLTYDHNILEATNISEASTLIAANKNLGTSNGTLTVDVTRSGPGALPESSSLVDVTFRVKAVSGTSTIVRVANTSTLGIPNILASNGYGQLALTLQGSGSGPVCGNGSVESGEVCDDGNTSNNDQCSNNCQNKCTAPQIWNGSACITPASGVCGDGTIQNPNSNGVNEVCDDGNTANNDQCSSTCQNKCTAPQVWNGSTCATPSTEQGLILETPLTLDKTTLPASGGTISGTVKYRNNSSSPISILKLVIAGRPPGGENYAGPYYDFTPEANQITIQPGAVYTLNASRTITSTDPKGQWYAYSTWRDTNGVWHDAPIQYNKVFTVGGGAASGICGDGVIQAPNSQGINEVCDDGNIINNDQCSSNCLNACPFPRVWDGSSCFITPQFSKVCGDGEIQAPNDAGVNEVCDDGNTANNDQCASDCRNKCIEPQIWTGTACVTPATGYCGDGQVQTPNVLDVNEVCDDGNKNNNDQCSNDCRNKCNAPQIWNGTTCRAPLDSACKGDYNGSGTIDIIDFQILAQNYQKQSIDCKFNIVGSACYLDIEDFYAFAQLYRVANICKL